jgi:predicted HicB family RNase H-like nuclease
MSQLEYKGYIGTVKYSAEDECLHGKLSFIRDLVNYEASTAKQLGKEFQAAVDEYLADCEKIGKKPDKPFKGSLNIRIGSDLHRGAALAAEDAGVKLNDFIRQAVSEKVERL